MTDGVHVIDRNYVIKVFNKGFSMGFRYLPVTQEDQVVGRNLFEIFPFIPRFVL